MHVPTLCDWFSSSTSACDSENLVFTFTFCHKQNQKNVFTGLLTPMLLITTPTLLLVKTSLKGTASGGERRHM